MKKQMLNIAKSLEIENLWYFLYKVVLTFCVKKLFL